jgi:Fe-S cluster assembly protein SufD
VSDAHPVTASVLSRDLVADASAAAGEPEWLRQKRLAAWEAFVRLPPPSPTDEEWRRTDLSGLDLDALRPLRFGVHKARAP